MNKAELVERIAGKAGITKVQAENAVSGFMEAVNDVITKGEKLTLVGFGTFSVSQRAARTGKNPRTGAKIKIAARKVPKFSPGQVLKDAANGAKKKTAAKKATPEKPASKATAKAAAPATKAPTKSSAKAAPAKATKKK